MQHRMVRPKCAGSARETRGTLFIDWIYIIDGRVMHVDITTTRTPNAADRVHKAFLLRLDVGKFGGFIPHCSAEACGIEDLANVLPQELATYQVVVSGYLDTWDGTSASVGLAIEM